MFIAAMAQKESNFGANLTTPYNPLNYGNTDDGDSKSFLIIKLLIIRLVNMLYEMV